MVRTREVAGGGRAVEVEPERLLGWFDRLAARHGGLVTAGGTPAQVRFRAADGTSADVAVPFGGLPADRRPAALREMNPDPDDLPANGLPAAVVLDGLHAADSPGTGAGDSDADRLLPGAPTDGPDAIRADPGAADARAVLDALHAHLTVPRRVGLVLVRLGGHSVGIAVGGVVETSSTGARPVHGRNRKGGSSSGRFARRRDNQARAALDAAADTVARVLVPVADTLDAVVLGGDTAALEALRADRRLAALLTRAEPRVLDVPEPRRAVLDEAARRALAVEIVVRDPES